MSRRSPKPKLYVILGSHACRTGILLVEHKRIDYDLITVPTVLHPLFVRLAGFSGERVSFRTAGDKPTQATEIGDRLGTVPSLKIDGERVRTNREISRALDRIKPDPPLFPADPAHRAAVEEAERWGDEVLQMVARRVTILAGAKDLSLLANHGDDGRLGTLLWRNRRVRQAGGQLVARFFRAGPHRERQLLDELPGQLDRIDGWIESGILNGERLNAADYMIVPSLALMSYRHDLRDEIMRRPAGRLVDRVLPEPAAAA